MNASEAPVTVYRAWRSHQAELLREWLEEEGIESRIASSAIETLVGKVPFQLATVPVLVHHMDFERARDVATQFDRLLAGDVPNDRTGSAPFCYHCGEVVDGKAPQCPSCGLDLDWSTDTSRTMSEPIRLVWWLVFLFLLATN